MRVLSVLLVVIGFMSSALAGALEFEDCKATWDDKSLVVGNRLFERTYRVDDNRLQTTSLKLGTKELIANERVGTIDSKLSVRGEIAARSSVGAKGIKLTITTKDKTRTAWVFSGVAGVLMEDPSVVDLSGWVPSPRLYNNVLEKLKYYLAGADVLHLKSLHVKATEYVMQDMTDIRCELVEKNSWMLMAKEEAPVISAAVVALEDTLTGEGIVYLRFAPLPRNRPGKEPDFVFGARAPDGSFNKVYIAAVANGYPVAEIAYRGGEFGRIRALHSIQTTLRPYCEGRDGVFLTNTWGDGSKDSRISADFMMKEVIAGGELGVDVIQIDDGWQSGKSKNSALLTETDKGSWGDFRKGNPNFWKPDPKKFPKGLAPLIAAAKERGMSFGLWFGPDKTDDYAGWRTDADTLLRLYQELGVKYFKIDGITAGSPKTFENIHHFFDYMLDKSNGEMTFDLDVTGAAKRPSYYGLPNVGPIFVENRYANGEGSSVGGQYWPHSTLRNLWMLSQVVNPVRLRMEIANLIKCKRFYGDDILAPHKWRADTVFATVMCASPLGWFEVSGLSREAIEEMKPLVAKWKTERGILHSGMTVPVGLEPDGVNWTGFATLAKNRDCAYVLLFRELNKNKEYELCLDGALDGETFTNAEVIGGRGTASLKSNSIKVEVAEKLDFVWVKLTKMEQTRVEGR